MSVETPIVRVFRGETWLTVYRSVAVRNRLGTPMGGTPQLLSVKKCDENQKLWSEALSSISLFRRSRGAKTKVSTFHI